MTDYGIRVYNDSDVLIIDSKYKNHVYHAHGTTTVGNYLNEVDIPDLSGSGIMFIKPTSFLTIGYGFIKNGSVYDKILIGADSTGTVDWIVYKESPDSPPSGDYGMNVYDSTGLLVFSSNETGYLNVSADGLYSQQQLTVNDADNNYFAIIGLGLIYNYSIHFNPPGFPNTVAEEYTRQCIGMKRIDSTTLDFDYFVYSYEYKSSPYAGGLSGTYSGSAGSSTVPQRYIEIKPPPSI